MAAAANRGRGGADCPRNASACTDEMPHQPLAPAPAPAQTLDNFSPDTLNRPLRSFYDNRGCDFRRRQRLEGCDLPLEYREIGLRGVISPGGTLSHSRAQDIHWRTAVQNQEWNIEFIRDGAESLALGVPEAGGVHDDREAGH